MAWWYFTWCMVPAILPPPPTADRSQSWSPPGVQCHTCIDFVCFPLAATTTNNQFMRAATSTLELWSFYCCASCSSRGAHDTCSVCHCATIPKLECRYTEVSAYQYLVRHPLPNKKPSRGQYIYVSHWASRTVPVYTVLRTGAFTWRKQVRGEPLY